MCLPKIIRSPYNVTQILNKKTNTKSFGYEVPFINISSLLFMLFVTLKILNAFYRITRGKLLIVIIDATWSVNDVNACYYEVSYASVRSLRMRLPVGG